MDPGFLAPPVPPKLIGGLGLSFAVFGTDAACDFRAAVRAWVGVLALFCSMLCRSFEVAAEEVPAVPVLVGGTVLFGALSDAVLLTFSVLCGC